MSVWEHRQALVRLKQRGAGQVDEHALFAMIDQMRRITDEATKTTRRTRRESERRRHAPAAGAPPPYPGPPPPPPPVEGGAEVPPAPWYPTRTGTGPLPDTDVLRRFLSRPRPPDIR